MKKIIFLIACCLILHTAVCFSQSDSNKKEVIKSKVYTVYGYLNNIDIYYLTIGFEKSTSIMDTSYFMVLGISSPASKYNTNICFNKADSIKILAKNGNFINIHMSSMKSDIKTEDYNKYERGAGLLNHITVLRLEITKEELQKIGLEPFYKIIFPYFDCSTKDYSQLEFEQPTLFTRRTFLPRICISILYN